MANRNNTWANLDWITILIYCVMMILGWLNIYAAVFNEEHTSIFDMTQRYGKQLLWILAAIVLATTILIIDSKFYIYFSYIFYAISIFLLLSVLLFGSEVKGAKAWFQIGTFAIQPSEFTKFTTALALAKFMSSYNFSIFTKNAMLGIAFILLLPVSLVLLQNDTGSALVFLTFVFVLYREGLPGMFLFIGLLMIIVFIMTLLINPENTIIVLSIVAFLVYCFERQNLVLSLKTLGMCAAVLVPPLAINYFMELDIDLLKILTGSAIIICIIFAIISYQKKLKLLLTVIGLYILMVFMTVSVDYVFHEVLGSHQSSRIEELLGLKSNPLGTGYNVNQSKIAIGSGGLSGKGFLNGTQTKFNFVPEQSTDFIFCTVGEEWGFAGTTIVISLFAFLMLRLIFLAERQRSSFSRIYGYCVASIIFFHFLINIGMTIGLVPVIGIPLPFFSYGGSSLWSFTILLFIFLRLDANRLEKLSS